MAWTADENMLQQYWDHTVADPPERRLPLPRDGRFPETVRLGARVDANHWTATETIPNSVDRETFERLRARAPGAAEVVVRMLAIFLGADEVVLGALGKIDPTQLRKKEVEVTIVRRQNQEVTHSEVYSNLAQCILDPATYARTQELDATHPAAAGLRRWVAENTQGRPPYKQQLALGVFEVVTFSALFVVPHALKKTSVCPTLSNANQLISRDESDHMDVAAAVMQEAYGTAPATVRAAAVREVRRLLESGCAAVDPMLQWVFETGKVVDVGLEEARAWTRYVCNRFMRQVNRLGQFDGSGGAEPVFPEVVECPLPWMELLSVPNERANFFEVAVAQYDKMVGPETLALPSAAEVANQPALRVQGDEVRLDGEWARAVAELQWLPAAAT